MTADSSCFPKAENIEKNGKNRGLASQTYGFTGTAGPDAPPLDPYIAEKQSAVTGVRHSGRSVHLHRAVRRRRWGRSRNQIRKCDRHDDVRQRRTAVHLDVHRHEYERQNDLLPCRIRWGSVRQRRRSRHRCVSRRAATVHRRLEHRSVRRASVASSSPRRVPTGRRVPGSSTHPNGSGPRSRKPSKQPDEGAFNNTIEPAEVDNARRRRVGPVPSNPVPDSRTKNRRRSRSSTAPKSRRTLKFSPLSQTLTQGQTETVTATAVRSRPTSRTRASRCATRSQGPIPQIGCCNAQLDRPGPDLLRRQATLASTRSRCTSIWAARASRHQNDPAAAGHRHVGYR